MFSYSSSTLEAQVYLYGNVYRNMLGYHRAIQYRLIVMTAILDWGQ